AEGHRHQIAVLGPRYHRCARSLRQECRHAFPTFGPSPLFRNIRAAAPYLGQELSRRLNPKMTTIPNKTLPRGVRSERPTMPHDEGTSAQALRPTFDGWGPRL